MGDQAALEPAANLYRRRGLTRRSERLASGGSAWCQLTGTVQATREQATHARAARARGRISRTGVAYEDHVCLMRKGWRAGTHRREGTSEQSHDHPRDLPYTPSGAAAGDRRLGDPCDTAGGLASPGSGSHRRGSAGPSAFPGHRFSGPGHSGLKRFPVGYGLCSEIAFGQVGDHPARGTRERDAHDPPGLRRRPGIPQPATSFAGNLGSGKHGQLEFH